MEGGWTGPKGVRAAQQQDYCKYGLYASVGQAAPRPRGTAAALQAPWPLLWVIRALAPHPRAQCSHRIKPLGACHFSLCAMDGRMLQKKPPQARPAGGPGGGWQGLAGTGRGWLGNPHDLAAMWGAALAPWERGSW